MLSVDGDQLTLMESTVAPVAWSADGTLGVCVSHAPVACRNVVSDLSETLPAASNVSIASE
jgi:hypothetical protein